jgi:hypothetical protein
VKGAGKSVVELPLSRNLTVLLLSTVIISALALVAYLIEGERFETGAPFSAALSSINTSVAS